MFYLLSDTKANALHLLASVATPALAVLMLKVQEAYSFPVLQSIALPYRKIIISWSTACFVLAPVLILTSGSSQSHWITLIQWYVSGLLLLFGTRMATGAVMASFVQAGRFDRRTAIVGGGAPAESLIQALETQPTKGIQILGIFDDRDDTRSPIVVANYPKLGRVSDLTDFARQQKVDLIIITLPITAEDRILQMLRDLWVLPVDIRLSAHASKLKLHKRSYSYIGAVPVFDLIDRPISDWGLVAKWLFDKVVGLALLIALTPVFAAVAIMVKLDSPGPILFRQNRYGFNNELIEVLKFRSLYIDQSDASSAKQVTKGDPRVTRVGRFIRKTSLDELPQLLNVVFKGNLSLVGPRPHALQSKAGDYLFDEVVESYFARHKVKPGVTGWAQIHGWRGETDTEEKLQRRVECDLYYIENWSLLLDVYILLMTPLSLLRSQNAY
jgi:Undecaprenyl-phosphate glucose phosphotransferase